MDSDKNKLFCVLLDLMKEFDRVCNENRIQYYAFAGTLLGAVRHKGFIPWDDDVDFLVPRKDYNRLKDLAKKGVFRYPFFFQNVETDKGFCKGFSRLMNENTTGLIYSEISSKCRKGIFIDIYPIDVIPDSKTPYIIQRRLVLFMIVLLRAYTKYYSGFLVNRLPFKKKMLLYFLYPLFVLHILSSRRIFYFIESIASRYRDKKSKKVGVFCFFGDNSRFIYNREWVDEVIYVPFETIKIPIPREYDSVLKKTYGDYMTPVKNASCHQGYFYTTEIGYKDYMDYNKDTVDKFFEQVVLKSRKNNKE